MAAYLIRNIKVVNEGNIFESDVLLKNGRIEKIAPGIDAGALNVQEYEGAGKHLFPGVIDDQVHFREPGLTHKADIYTEARAAVAGGVTSFMEMPNTNPQSVTIEELEKKYTTASKNSLANYSFYLGATNDNVEELLKMDKNTICGVKVFMGSSTGNMLVDAPKVLEKIFSECDSLIAIHSESEPIIVHNLEVFKKHFNNNIPMAMHPHIRSMEACFLSTKNAIGLANKFNTRLHVLHISTAEELDFFNNTTPLENKRITSEVCVHHLWYDASSYDNLGGLIKCNPAIKQAMHKEALLKALLNNTIDVIATDHAPHTWEEKQNGYLECPSGLPLVQHPLLMMLEFYKKGKIDLPMIAQKMCHDVAKCFQINERGYIREGYKADVVVVDLYDKMNVNKENIYYKCGWSPLEGFTFNTKIVSTFVNGDRVFHQGIFDESTRGERLQFRGQH